MVQTYNPSTEAGRCKFQATLSYRTQKTKPNQQDLELYKARWYCCLCVSENEAGGEKTRF